MNRNKKIALEMEQQMSIYRTVVSLHLTSFFGCSSIQKGQVMEAPTEWTDDDRNAQYDFMGRRKI
jgi:hypothetical protein